jgi:3-phosphoshikimate 1-carboxyvinyltransferase
MPAVSEAVIRPAARIQGSIRVPGDKSISHRYALLSALARGRSTIRNYSTGADCGSTLACLRGLGVDIDVTAAAAGEGPTLRIVGRGLRGLHTPSGELDAGNSGTTLRLLSGIVAAHPFSTTITGDESLRRRPMGRIIQPLTAMGARIGSLEGRAPLTIDGGGLHPIDYSVPVPSAQVKSAVLLAGIQAPGVTSVRETVPTRDHTELALRVFGADVSREGLAVFVRGETPLSAAELTVPGDVSSATFWAVLAAALPGSDVEFVDLGLNPTRTALFDVLEEAGARVERAVETHGHAEPRGRVRVRHGGLRPLTLGASTVPLLIDELPALAAMATHGAEIHVTGAGELRVKESDRITALVNGLRALGAEAEEFPDGFHIRGRARLTGGTADAAGDHRLAMAFAVAALGGRAPSLIRGAEAVSVSYPGFFETLASLTGADG